MEGQQPAYSQLEVTPITLLNSPPVYQRGSLIAVNHNYICYVVKGNMIRVINIFSAKRALLRGHTKGITDLRFCGGNGDVLASVAADGRLLVWRFSEEATSTPSSGDEEAGIGHELVAAVRMEGDRWSERIIWHPVHSHLLATAGNDQHAYVWDLKRIRQLKHTAEDGKNVFVYAGTEPVDGVIRIAVGAPINDLAFAPGGEALATASSDGRVQIWSASGGATPTPSLSWLAHENEAWGVVYHQEGKILITGGQHNAELCVWQLSEDEGTEPVLLQRIKFAPPPSGAIFNHIVLESSGNYLFVANAKSTTFMVLHLQTQPQPRFDYLTEFSVAQAILSFTVLNRGTSKTEPEMDLYCLQTKAIQMYHITSNLCYAAPSAATAAPPAAAAVASAALPTPPGSGGAPTVPATAATSRSTSPSPKEPLAASPAPSPPTSTTSAESSAQAAPVAEPSRPESPSNAVVEPSAAAAEPTHDKQSIENGPTSPAAVAPEPTPAPSAQDELAAPQPSEAQPEPTPASAPEEKPSAATPAEPAENGHAEPATTDVEVTAKPEEPEQPVEKGEAAGETEPAAETSAAAPVEEKEKEAAGEGEAEATPSPADEVPEFPVQPAETESAGVENKEEAAEALVDEEQPPKAEEQPQPEPEAKEEPTPAAVATPETAPTTAEGEMPQSQLKTPGELAQPPAPVPSPTVSKPSGASPSGRGKQPKKPKAGKAEGRAYQATGQAVANAQQPLARAPPAEVSEPTAAPVESTAAPAAGNLQAELRRMENSLLNGINARMERALQQHADRQVAKAEKDRQERDKAERERQQRLLAAVTQAVNAGLTGIPQQVEKAVQKELQTALVPALGRLLTSLEKNLAKSLADDLKPVLAHGQTNGTWAQDLPPRLASEVASRLPSANDIANALQGSVRHAMEASFRSSFQETIIPSFQGSCQSMFQQIYGTMLPGLQQTIEEAVEPGLNKLATGDLRETLQSLTNAVNDLRELSARNAELFQTLSQSSPSARLGLQPPGSGLPEQHVTEAQLLQLLERDAYEQAFACALSERGAEAVRHLLQWIEPQGFFESGHGLSQIVTASLIHRVALDLQHDTPLKLDWLSHLLLHFHPMDTTIAAHSQHILHHTIHHLNALLAAQPHHPLAINAKLLLHTANSLLSAPPPLQPATPSFSSLPYGAPYI